MPAIFQLVEPSPLLMHIPWSKTASTAFTEGSLVKADDDNSGIGFDAADATSTLHIGILRQTIASTDSDYASTTRIALEVDLMGYYKAEVGTGTPTTNYEGYTADLTSGGKIDVSATTVNVFLIRDFISATYVGGYIVRWAYVNP